MDDNNNLPFIVDNNDDETHFTLDDINKIDFTVGSDNNELQESGKSKGLLKIICDTTVTIVSIAAVILAGVAKFASKHTDEARSALRRLDDTGSALHRLDDTGSALRRLDDTESALLRRLTDPGSASSQVDPLSGIPYQHTSNPVTLPTPRSPNMNHEAGAESHGEFAKDMLNASADILESLNSLEKDQGESLAPRHDPNRASAR